MYRVIAMKRGYHMGILLREFNNQNHFDNFMNKVNKGATKVIGVYEFEPHIVKYDKGSRLALTANDANYFKTLFKTDDVTPISKEEGFELYNKTNWNKNAIRG